jgi:hypothetical protein
MADHGVEDGQQFAHDGDEGDLGGFAGGAEPEITGAERRIVAGGHQGGHVEGGADRRPPAPDENFIGPAGGTVEIFENLRVRK